MSKKTYTSWGQWLKSNIKALFWALLIALTIRSVAFEPFNIPSGSMIPSLLVGDYLFVNKASYGYSRHSFPFSLPIIPKNVSNGRLFYSQPQRGDVIVFRLPNDTSIDYIKRVIGLPGDKIQLKEGLLYINGIPVKRTFQKHVLEKRRLNAPAEVHALYEEELPNGVKHNIIEFADNLPQDNTEVFVVPEGHLFVMGDNRDNSQDSRWKDKVGFIPIENIVGKASFIFYSHGQSLLSDFGRNIRWSRFFNKINP